MYCIECGKQNPEGAKFCAFCGKKLFTGEIGAAGEENAPEQMAAAAQADIIEEKSAEPVKAAPAQPVQETPAVYQRARNYKTVQPLAENPAQPGRAVKAPVPAAGPVREELQEDIAPEEEIADIPAEDEVSLFAQEDVQEEKTAPPFGEDDLLWRAPNVPDEDWWGDEESEEESVSEPEEKPEKKKFVFPWQKSKEENMVLTADGEEEMPARKPVISRKRRDTHIPERIIKQPEPDPEPFDERDDEADEERRDIFFMRPKKPARPKEEDTFDDAYVNSRVRTILFSIAFVVCLGAALWLFATNSGQMFLAGFNLSSDAQAYRDLGDSARANNQIKRAAEAYYRALSLDPDDYDTALLVGRTQQQIGEYDKAANAYYMCTQLMPTEKEPYEALVRLYEIQNEPEKADYFRELGLVYAGIIIE